MTTVLFLQRDSYECFGVMYLAAALAEAGHRAEVLIEVEEGRRFFSQIESLKPDIIAFSVMSGLEEWTKVMAARVKERFGIHVIVGGPHCTFFPEFINEPGIDALCRGEGEDALADYLAAFSSGGDLSRIPGWLIKNDDGQISENGPYPLREHLDSLVYPDRDIYSSRYSHFSRTGNIEVLAARGCPFNCSFCYNQYLKSYYGAKGKYTRRHSPARIIDEIKSFREKKEHTLRRISFVDDLFIMDRKWLQEFLSIYSREVALPFGCSLRANLVDENLIDMLVKAGCKTVSFGVESGDSELRNTLLNKNISDGQIIFTGKQLEKHGMRFSTFNMFNLPGETLESAMETLNLNLKIRSGNYPWSGLLQPYRGTAIYEHANELGLLPPGESGANLFHKATIRQRDSEVLEQFNSYFYWMVRCPSLIPVFMQLVKHPVKILSKMALLLASFHRSVMLNFSFEGYGAVWSTLKSGLKRIKAYL